MQNINWKNKIKALDLFAGAGGISNGLSNAGIDVVLANEIDKDFAKTYELNHKDTLMCQDDIKIFSEGLGKYSKGSIDLIVGGPPCQGFSMAGERIRGKKRFLHDPRNYLFKYYFKTVQYFEPEMFFFENVTGITNMDNGSYLDEIVKLFTTKSNFTKDPYHLSFKIIDFSNFGVPQKRRRFIMLGSKKPIGTLDEIFNSYLSKLPNDSKFKMKPNIRDAISDLNYLESGEGTFKQNYRLDPMTHYQKLMRNNINNLYNHVATNHNDKALQRIRQLDQGQNREHLNEVAEINSVHSGSYGRMRWDDQAVTITTRFDTPSGGRFIHPEMDRTITPREAARIQSFPDDFVFEGSKTKISTMIGNAVPPLFAEFLGNIIKII